jgi:phage-related minor tail protein
VRGEVEKPFPVGVERNPLANDTAERIAASADRLERQAAEVRAADKQLALRLMKEATKLRRVARSIDIQHKQAERARMRRKGLLDADAREFRQEMMGTSFLPDAGESKALPLRHAGGH